MRKKFYVALALTLAVGLLLAPGVSKATHCSNLFIFSGPMRAPDNPATTGGFNGGCVVAREEVNTNILVPAATFIVVGATDNGKGKPTTGEVKFTPGGTVQINWSLQETATGATRYISQTIELPASAGSVRATAKVGQTDGTFTNQSVTYAKVA